MIDLSSIAHGAKITIDTAPIIYLLEGNQAFLESYLPLFQSIETGEYQGVISAVTLAEVLAGPMKQGHEILVERYYQALTAGNNWQVQEMNAEVALIAARVRARYGLKLPDAVQVATAIVSQSAALVTHDRDFAGITEVAVKIGK